MAATMAKVKICGIKTKDDLTAVSEAKADWVGFVFFEKSPRHLTLEQARQLLQHRNRLSHQPQIVVLTVDADDEALSAILDAADPDLIQCHGHETPERVEKIKRLYNKPVMKAFRVKDKTTFDDAMRYDGIADMMLFDSAPIDAALPGGTGHQFDWGLISSWRGETPWMLAGGLNASNVADAINISGALAVDVSSGVEEKPGIKSAAAIHRFVSEAR